ncbi:MAG: DUF6671 family protein [Bacteroidota bacterium]
MFSGRTLFIATKHEKEKVIAPILEAKLKLQCETVPNIDTDVLGTFTGEIERQDDPITTARNKCKLAQELTNADLILASEGSFGPHPTIPFISCNEEHLLLLDVKNQMEFITTFRSMETNFNARTFTTLNEIKKFAHDVLFPSHALIIRPSKDDYSSIHKGITDEKELEELASQYITLTGHVYIETDMRAHHNPTRMEQIKKATLQLVEQIESKCPKCNTPGFSVTDVRRGLACSLCKSPTNSALSLIYSCKNCFFTNESLYPKNKKEEDPMYCDHCNP